MTQILLAGRMRLLTEGLHALFDKESDFGVIGVTDAAQAGKIAHRDRADVTIVDLLIQAPDGPAVIAEIRKQAPSTKIVVLSISVEPSYVGTVMTNGASAYVLKGGSFGELVRAVRAVVSGGQYLSPPLDERAIETWQRKQGNGHSDSFNTLTARERQVLQFAAEGHTSAQIAAQLGISRRTAETHRANIYKKLLLESRTDLIALALRRGLLARDV